MTFQIGNTLGGRPKDKPYRDALRAQIAAAGEDSKRLRRIAEAHLKRCERGDLAAIGMLADRLDGKAHQAIDINDESSAPGYREWLAWVIADGVRMREALEAKTVELIGPPLDTQSVDSTKSIG